MNRKPPILPEERSGHVVAAWRDGMYIWGGFDDLNNESRRLDPEIVWKYNIYTHTWSKHVIDGEIPEGRLGSSASVINDQLIMFGGCTFRGDFNDLAILNLSKMTWHFPEVVGLKPSERNKHATCPYNNRVICFGGYGPQPLEEEHFQNGKFDIDYSSLFHNRGWNNHLLAYDLSKNKWTPLKSSGRLPLSRAAHSFTAIGNKAYLFGGRHEHERLGDLHSLCLETHHWTKLKPSQNCEVPVGRSWHSFTAISKTELFLFGGLNSTDNILCDGWVFKITDLSWRKAPDKDLYRLWHTACRGSFEGEILVFGGCVNNIFYDSIHCNTVLRFVLQPKSLQRICMEHIARQPKIRSLTKLPLPIYRSITALTGEGG